MAAYSSRRRGRGSRRAPEPEPEEEVAPRRSGVRGRDRTREVHRRAAQKSHRDEAAAKLTFLKPLGFGLAGVVVLVILLMIPGFVRRARFDALSNPNARARLKAVVNLAESGSSAVPKLRARAKSERAADAACLALGMIAAKDGGESALEALVELAASENAEVRRAAAAGLGRAGRAKGLEALEKLRADDDPSVAIEAIGALGAIRGKDAAEALLTALAAAALGEEEKQEAARRALARAVDGSCRKLLEEALSRPQASVRRAARELLPVVAEGVSADRVETLFASESASARKTAMEIAATLGQGDMGAVVKKGLADEKAAVRVAALRAAAALDLRAFAEKAIGLLASEAEEERAAACEYLGATYAMSAILPLSKAVAGADVPVQVRRAAFRALARLAPFLGDGKSSYGHPDQEARWVVVEAIAPAFEKLPEELEGDATAALAAVSGWRLVGLPAADCREGLAKKRALAAGYGEARHYEKQADAIQASKTRDPKKIREAYDFAVKARDLYRKLFEEADFTEDKALFNRLYEEMKRRTGGEPGPAPRPGGEATRKETP